MHSDLFSWCMPVLLFSDKDNADTGTSKTVVTDKRNNWKWNRNFKIRIGMGLFCTIYYFYKQYFGFVKKSIIIYSTMRSLTTVQIYSLTHTKIHHIYNAFYNIEAIDLLGSNIFSYCKAFWWSGKTMGNPHPPQKKSTNFIEHETSRLKIARSRLFFPNSINNEEIEGKIAEPAKEFFASCSHLIPGLP